MGFTKIRHLTPIVTCLTVSACAQQLNVGTGQVRSTVAEIFIAQAESNIAHFVGHPDAIPSQIQLSAGQATVQNSVSSGIAPNIALRAIAITGINLSGTSTVQENWQSTPVTNYSDIARLQMLYRYSLAHEAFEDFEDAFTNLHPKVGSLSKVIGPLPDGPLVSTGTQCNGNTTRTTVSGHVICFNAKNRMSAEDVRDLFTLWTIATPQMKPLPGKTHPTVIVIRNETGKPITVPPTPRKAPPPQRHIEGLASPGARLKALQPATPREAPTPPPLLVPPVATPQ